MTIPFKSNMALRQIGKLGEPAVIVEFAVSGKDSQGDDLYTETRTDVEVVPSTSTNTRLPFIRRGELGNYYMMQMEFFMSDVYEKPNTAVDRMPVLIHEGLEYEIMESENAKNNLIRILGYRKRV
jgi:hypothetical protein